MIDAGKKIRNTVVLLMLSVIIIAAAISAWLLLSGKETQQDKIYSGAKLVKGSQAYVLDWGIL